MLNKNHISIHIYLVTVFLILFNGLLSGQNLIPNASFEGGWACPEDFTKDPVKELIPHWMNPNKGTPDYFHACSDSMAGIPDNFAGNMPAYEGDAYIGLILREVFIDSVSPRKVSREYITVELNKPLDFRKLYCFKLHYVLADRSSFAVDALGISFTREKLKAWDAGLLDAEPMVFNTPGHIMNNKNQWHELCGVFRARGREKFMTIGNFCPNVKTHYYEATDSLADSTFVYAYYYIDDVKLYEIENPFECGCQDDLSQGFDWLDDASLSFTEAYNNYRKQLEHEEMLASAKGNGERIKTELYNDDSNDDLSGDRKNDEKDTSESGDSNKNGKDDSQNDPPDKNDPLTDTANDALNEDTGGIKDDTGEATDTSDFHDDRKESDFDNNKARDKNEQTAKGYSGNDYHQNDTSGEAGGKHRENNDINELKDDKLAKYESISGQLRKSRLNKNEEALIESLKNADTGFSINLPKIYFAFNQSELLPSSYIALEELSKILEEHKSLQIEIRGHTDNIGSNWYNKRLSNDRAEAVYDFLIETGIDESRLKYRGFGNKVPVADNDTEEGRQLNRRVEIKVISNR